MPHPAGLRSGVAALLANAGLLAAGAGKKAV